MKTLLWALATVPVPDKGVSQAPLSTLHCPGGWLCHCPVAWEGQVQLGTDPTVPGGPSAGHLSPLLGHVPGSLLPHRPPKTQPDLRDFPSGPPQVRAPICSRPAGWRQLAGCRGQCSVMSSSLWPHGLQPARLLCPWESPGKNPGVDYHVLLQGIFSIQGSRPHLLQQGREGYAGLHHV